MWRPLFSNFDPSFKEKHIVDYYLDLLKKLETWKKNNKGQSYVFSEIEKATEFRVHLYGFLQK